MDENDRHDGEAAKAIEVAEAAGDVSARRNGSLPTLTNVVAGASV
jgi:hypothetical protein